MTYPQYAQQQAPAPTYGQPVPQAPGAYPQTGQGYPMMANTADPFTDPTGGGVASPRPRHLRGRTVIIIPNRIDDTAKYKDQPRPCLWATLMVVDGGPVHYGDDSTKGTPATWVSATPAVFQNVPISSGPIVESCRTALPMGGNPPGVVLGVIELGTKGTKGQPPWLLLLLHKMVDGSDRNPQEVAARRQAALQLYQAVQSGQHVNPVPQPVGQAATAPAHVQYAQVASPGPTMPQGQPMPMQQAPGYGGPQAPVQPWQQQAAPQPMPQGPYMPMAAPDQAQPTPGAQAPVQQAGGTPPPQGWDPSAWAGFTPEQQAAIAAQGQAQPAPTGHPGI